jgi:hypothetical protein
MRKLQRTSIDSLESAGRELTAAHLAAVTGGKPKSVINDRCEGDPGRCYDPSRVREQHQVPRW